MNSNITSIIQFGSNSLVKAGNSIKVTNKILEEYKSRLSKKKYLLLLQSESPYILSCQLKYYMSQLPAPKLMH